MFRGYLGFIKGRLGVCAREGLGLWSVGGVDGVLDSGVGLDLNGHRTNHWVKSRARAGRPIARNALLPPCNMQRISPGSLSEMIGLGLRMSGEV